MQDFKYFLQIYSVKVHVFISVPYINLSLPVSHFHLPDLMGTEYYSLTTLI